MAPFALLAAPIRQIEPVPVPDEWLAYMADPLLAQSAIDRLQSAAHELVLDGDSYRRRQKPSIVRPDDALDPPRRTRDHPVADHDTPMKWSHATGARVVPSSWRTTPGEAPL